MAPKLVKEGKIQILGQTANSVVYAIANDSETGWAKDSPSVLKGGTVWYEGQEALGPYKNAEESDKKARKEAGIYEALGRHDCILSYLRLEESIVGDSGSVPKAWAVRLERAPYGNLRDYIINNSANPPEKQTRLQLATQFTDGVAHMHLRGVVWGDLSTRNAFLFDQGQIKLGDFADSDKMDDYPGDWYGCETRYCPPGSARPHCHNIGTMKREMFALGSAIYEISEWKVPYGSETEVSEDEVMVALLAGKWPELSNDNPAGPIIRRLWGYMYKSSGQVADDLRGLF